MTHSFDNHAALAAAIVSAIADALPKTAATSCKFGYSNQSVSAYLNVTFWRLDDDGDAADSIDGFKLRVSDHDDRYGSDATIRIDGAMTDIEDDMGFVGCEVEGWKFDELVAAGVEKIEAARANV